MSFDGSGVSLLFFRRVGPELWVGGQICVRKIDLSSKVGT